MCPAGCVYEYGHILDKIRIFPDVPEKEFVPARDALTTVQAAEQVRAEAAALHAWRGHSLLVVVPLYAIVINNG
jgi:hypothetical protein